MKVLSEQIEDHPAGNTVFIGSSRVHHRLKKVRAVDESSGEELIDPALSVATIEEGLENPGSRGGFRQTDLFVTIPEELHIVGGGTGGHGDGRLEEGFGQSGIVRMVDRDGRAVRVDGEVAGEG